MALSLKRKPKDEANAPEAAPAKKKRVRRKGKGEGEAPKKSAKSPLGNGKKRHFAFFIGDDGAILVYMEGRTVVRRLFAPTAGLEHTKTIIELMGQHPQAPVRVFMDVIDQQYLRQTFPPVSKLSLGGIVDRRLQRDFAAEDLKGAILLGREETARKDWIFLLVALTNTTHFQQWMELILEQPNRLQGVYLLPVETENFLKALGQAMPDNGEETPVWQMLISHNKVSGFRIVVLRNGKLTFSRVGQAVGEASPAVLAGNIEQEIQNSIEYIRRLGYNDGAGLEVFSISSAEVRDSIDPKRINAARINLLSPFDVAELLDLKQAALAADRFGDVVLASALSLSKKTPLQLKPVYAQKLDKIYMARLGLRAVAALAVLALVAMAGISVAEVFSARSKVRELEASLAQGTPSLALLRRQVDQLGIDVNTKSDIVSFFSIKKPGAYSPIDAIDELGKLRSDSVSIEGWEWTRMDSAGTEGAQQQASAPDAQAYPVKIEAKAELIGEFPDNQTILETVARYREYLASSIKDYKIEIPGSDLAGGSKISVAVGAAKSEDATPQSTTLNVIMHGPVEQNAAQNQASPAAPGGGAM